MYDCLPTSGFGAELYASSKIFISLRLRRDPVNPHTPLSACLRRTGSPTSQTLCSSLKTMIRTQKFARNIWGSNGSDVLQLLSSGLQCRVVSSPALWRTILFPRPKINEPFLESESLCSGGVGNRVT